MKSRMIIILALLLIFSAGLTQPLDAVAGERFEVCQLETRTSGRVHLVESDESPDATGTLGDPDGWLGGQNFVPSPKINDGSESTDLVLEEPGTSASRMAWLFLILTFIGF